MNIYNVLKTTLASLTVPCVPITYGGPETTYITYLQYNKKGSAFAETTKEMAKDYHAQVDIYSKTLEVELEEQVEALLTNSGFCEITAQDLYESETKTFHTAISCTYVDEHS